MGEFRGGAQVYRCVVKLLRFGQAEVFALYLRCHLLGLPARKEEIVPESVDLLGCAHDLFGTFEKRLKYGSLNNIVELQCSAISVG